MTLHISMAIPDRSLEKSPIDQAVTRLATRVASEKRNLDVPDGPALDLTFMMSTAEKSPGFTGMRMGGYTAEGNTLYFETAVPVHIGQSSDAEAYVQAVLQDVISNAQDFFKENHIAFDSGQWQRTLHLLA